MGKEAKPLLEKYTEDCRDCLLGDELLNSGGNWTATRSSG